MTRTLFFFTSIAAMLAALTAVLIRAEHAAPGISALFATSGDVTDSARFATTTLFHTFTSHLTVVLLGTTLASAARDKHGLFSGLTLWTGVILTLTLVVLTALVFVPKAGVPLPEVVQAQLTNLSDRLFMWLNPDRLVAQDLGAIPLTNLLLAPVAALLFMGAYTLLGTERHLRWLPVLGLITVIAASTGTVALLPQNFIERLQFLFVLPALPFLAAASVRLSDASPPWLIVFTSGLILSIATQVTAALTWVRGVDTIATTTSLYIFPLGLVWFALPALILYRFGTTLPSSALWLIAPLISFGVALWTVPLMQAGWNGQPAGYIDYSTALAPQNSAASVSVGLFVLGYLALIAWLMRRRATD